MNIKTLLAPSLVLFFALIATQLAQAQQVYANDAEWKESETPPPPAFDVNKLVILDVPTSLTLIYGIDPASVSISKSDGLVRYVVVASSTSGVRNVMYEGLRCATGEFKTYARFSSDGKWRLVSNPEWRSIFDNMPSKHALQFARTGACDGVTPVDSVPELFNKMKNLKRYLN